MNVSSVINPAFQFEFKKTDLMPVQVHVLGGSSAQRTKQLKQIVNDLALPHAREALLKSDKKTLYFAGAEHSVWIIQPRDTVRGQHKGLLDESAYGWFRDQAASCLWQIKGGGHTQFQLFLGDVSDQILQAIVVGFELAQYQFLPHFKKAAGAKPSAVWTVNVQSFKLGKLSKTNEKLIKDSQLEATAIQLARHLVNLPPNEANPQTIEEMTLKQLNWPKGKVKITVWDDKKLKAENMNLLLAVGAGSPTAPRMIHIQYRPQVKSSKKPVAFVGKGITFDTGGLDIKPSSAMRLMKKDMGGAAAVIGLAYWVAHSGCKQPCDFYLALAENGIDANAMRPSDVYMSRAGLLVEIDNTDAEGRLVLADTMDVAAKQTGANEPEYLIDLATLTGAIKVALGAEVAGLFCNDDKLASELEWAGQAVGESNWRMPLVQKYFGSLSSPFADFKNSGEGFGGAITAALFLEKFCAGKKWAHLDIYAWADRMNGPYASAGGNGQAVQTLIHWLKSK